MFALAAPAALLLAAGGFAAVGMLTNLASQEDRVQRKRQVVGEAYHGGPTSVDGA